MSKMPEGEFGIEVRLCQRGSDDADDRGLGGQFGGGDGRRGRVEASAQTGLVKRRLLRLLGDSVIAITSRILKLL